MDETIKAVCDNIRCMFVYSQSLAKTTCCH